MAMRKNVTVVPASKAGSAPVPSSALPLLEVARSVTTWLTAVSTERTRREHIAAQRDAVFAVVEARRSLAELAIRQAMDERVHALDGLLAALDAAIAAQDVDTTTAVLQQVGAVATAPPFASVADLLRAWDDPDTTIVL